MTSPAALAAIARLESRTATAPALPPIVPPKRTAVAVADWRECSQCHGLAPRLVAPYWNPQAGLCTACCIAFDAAHPDERSWPADGRRTT